MLDAYLDADGIRASTFIRHVEIHETLGSTNDRAAELARDPDIELPALVASRHQTAGRGRGKNVWHSADGALTFSILLDPSTLGISAANWPQLSLATAVAICDALTIELNESNQRAEASPPPIGLADEPARSNPRLAIKWPNDVLLGDAKIAGILIESPGGGAPAKDRLIIGIGMNVNNSWHDTSVDEVVAGTSCYDVTNHLHDLQNVLIAVLKAVVHRLSQQSANDARLLRNWQELCWLREKLLEVQLDNGRAIGGTCLGIDRDGALLIETPAGTQRTHSGSVRLLPPLTKEV